MDGRAHGQVRLGYLVRLLWVGEGNRAQEHSRPSHMIAVSGSQPSASLLEVKLRHSKMARLFAEQVVDQGQTVGS